MAVTESDHRPVGFYAARAPKLPTRRREELCLAVQRLLADRPVMDVLASSDNWPRRRSIRAQSASGLFSAVQPVGVGDLDLSSRGVAPRDAHLGRAGGSAPVS